MPYSGSDNACGSDKMCTFRVVSKDENSIKIILNGLLPKTSAWADNASDNINVDDLIYTTALKPFVANIDSKYIIAGTYGVGMYTGGNNYTIPQSITISTNIGLPTVGEMFSGNDIDMGSTKTFVDENTIENPAVNHAYWTMNRDEWSSIIVVISAGNFNKTGPSGSGSIRPVIYLKSGSSALTFTGGEGTPQSPYVLQ